MEDTSDAEFWLLDFYREHPQQFLEDMNSTWRNKMNNAFMLIDENDMLYQLLDTAGFIL